MIHNMKTTDFKKKSSDTANEVRFLRTSVLLLSAVTLVMLLYSIMRGGNTTVDVQIPPNITQSFWIQSHGDFDKSYLEQMGTFISYLVLNATPESIKFQGDILKPYLSPKAYGAFQIKLDARKERMKKYQVSTAFHPQQIYLSKSGKCRIQVAGSLQTFIGGVQSKSKPEKITIDCENINGRFYVTGIALDHNHQF